MLSPPCTPYGARSLSPRGCKKSVPFPSPAAAAAVAVVPQPPLSAAPLVLLSAPTLSHFLSTLVSFRVRERERERERGKGRSRRNIRRGAEREREREWKKRNVSEARYAKVDKKKSARGQDGEERTSKEEKEGRTAMAKR